MKPAPFLLDVDGVVADFLGSALNVVEAVTGRCFRPEDFETWEIFDTIGHEHEDACYARFREPGFCNGIRPYPGAGAGAQRIADLMDVRVLTSPIHGPHWYFERVQWCTLHLGVPVKHVIQTSEKHLVRGSFILDDRPAHVEAWAAAHQEGLGLLWDQPYNRSWNVSNSTVPNQQRVFSWDGVWRIVSGRLARAARRA